MDRSLALLAIGLFFGGGIGFVTAASQGVTLDGHDHSQPHSTQAQLHQHANHKQVGDSSGGSEGHRHGRPIRLTAGPDSPQISATLHKDAVAGWNLHVVANGFRFSPENASKKHVAGEGHAHVYVNGTKIARLYSPWMHIAELPADKVMVKVTLNSNDHRPLFVADKPLAYSLTVTDG